MKLAIFIKRFDLFWHSWFIGAYTISASGYFCHLMILMKKNCSYAAFKHNPIELNRIFEFIKCFYVKKRNCDVCGHRLLQYLRGRSRGRESLPLFLCDLILLYCCLGTYGLEYTHPILNNTSLLFDQKVDLLFLPELVALLHQWLLQSSNYHLLVFSPWSCTSLPVNILRTGQLVCFSNIE